MLAEYVRHLADLLKLNLWDLEVAEVEHPGDDPDAFAFVDFTTGRWRAKIEVASSVVEKGGPDLRLFVTHELIHVMQNALGETLRLPLLGQLTQSTYDLLFAVFKREEELMADHISRLLAPTLPLFEDYQDGIAVVYSGG